MFMIVVEFPAAINGYFTFASTLRVIVAYKYGLLFGEQWISQCLIICSSLQLRWV
jgi:hypothetical protein